MVLRFYEGSLLNANLYVVFTSWNTSWIWCYFRKYKIPIKYFCLDLMLIWKLPNIWNFIPSKITPAGWYFSLLAVWLWSHAVKPVQCDHLVATSVDPIRWVTAYCTITSCPPVWPFNPVYVAVSSNTMHACAHTHAHTHMSRLVVSLTYSNNKTITWWTSFLRSSLLH